MSRLGARELGVGEAGQFGSHVRTGLPSDEGRHVPEPVRPALTLGAAARAGPPALGDGHLFSANLTPWQVFMRCDANVTAMFASHASLGPGRVSNGRRSAEGTGARV